MTNISVGFGPDLNLEAIIEVIRTVIGINVMKGMTVIIVLRVSIMRVIITIVIITRVIITRIIMTRITTIKTEISTKFPSPTAKEKARNCEPFLIRSTIKDLLDERSVKAEPITRRESLAETSRDPFKVGNVAIPPPAQKIFDAAGEILEQALTKSFCLRKDAIKDLCSCVPPYAAFGTRPSRKNANAIIRTLFRRCGKP